MHKERFLYLLDQYFHKTITSEEQEELNEMITEPEVNIPLEDWMNEKWLSYFPEEKLPAQDADRYFSKIVAAIEEKAESPAAPLRNRITFFNSYWTRVAAVLVIAVAGFVMYLVNGKGKENSGSVEAASVLPLQDVTPGGNFATLTLADGSQVILDSMSNGLVASQGNARVVKLDNGEIRYETEKAPGRVFHNTMTTPVGGEYRLVLPDGTGVWLNAASSITYPTAFAGRERKVSVTGEVYFEVAKNAAMPFKVQVGEQMIEVLGTHFNVNAYGNEHTINTTLAEGRVKITERDKTILLQPGQQVRNDKNGKLKLVRDPDMDEILAWKDGVFRFNGTDIETIMRQVARWYGVEVVYKDKIAEQFVAEIPRGVNVSKLLELLELTKQVHFTVNNKVITVTR
ncbi:MAG: FecR domain-containing protein [Chitinophagaceae bacterium]|nr:FecR domain-containing protein [Chitinophagaceae bacterium]